MFINTRCSISAICVLICEYASSASGVQQLERPTASALISACLKHTFQKGTLKRAIYENSTFLLFFFPQVVDIFPVCLLFLFFFSFWFQVVPFPKYSQDIHVPWGFYHQSQDHISHLEECNDQSNKRGYFHLFIHIPGLSLIMFELLSNLTLCCYLLLAMYHCQRVLLDQLGFCCTSTTSLQWNL